jgi:hypothetical protein
MRMQGGQAVPRAIRMTAEEEEGIISKVEIGESTNLAFVPGVVFCNTSTSCFPSCLGYFS